MSLLRAPLGLIVAVTAVGSLATARTAYAADGGALLVIVEAAPGLGVSAADVRQAVATDLTEPVLAPNDRDAGEARDILVVSLDQHEIHMSLRAGAETRLARAISLPPDPAARLRAIGWLAGNLARDQVSGIVGGSVTPLSIVPLVEASAGPAPAAAMAPAAIEPPPMPVAASAPAAPPAETIATRATPATGTGGPGWTITAAIGPSLVRYDLQESIYGGFAYHLEVQRQASRDGLIVGVAVEAGPVSQLLGICATVGSRRQHQGWFLEAAAGIGIEAAEVLVVTTNVTSDSRTGIQSSAIESNGFRPALTARVVGTLGLSIARSFDLVVSLVGHLASAGLDSDFVAVPVGLRFTLP